MLNLISKCMKVAFCSNIDSRYAPLSNAKRVVGWTIKHAMKVVF